MSGKTPNRWTIVSGALLIQLCLGAVYSWSVFVKPLIDGFGYTTKQTQAVFSLALASFAFVMIFAGRWQDRRGPRIVALAGAVTLGAGYILAGFTGGSFIGLCLTIGLVGGAGIGLGYVCPIAACVKWFPDKRGMISGLAVAGFGAGAWVFAKLGGNLIESVGILKTFQYFGLIFLATVLAGASLLKNPPKDYRPPGWTPAKQKQTPDSSQEDYEHKQMLKTTSFWLLWLMFTFSASAGLMVIGNLKPFGIYSGLSAAAAGNAVGVLALANGAGRIIWGTTSDRIGRKKAMLAMFTLQGIMMLSLTRFVSNEITLALAAAWVGFNFGGNFALFPSATADYFGTKNVGLNYGLVFTAYGIAGITGPILGGMVYDATGSYQWAFIPAGTACLIAAATTLKTKKPTPPKKTIN